MPIIFFSGYSTLFYNKNDVNSHYGTLSLTIFYCFVFRKETDIPSKFNITTVKQIGFLPSRTEEEFVSLALHKSINKLNKSLQ